MTLDELKQTTDLDFGRVPLDQITDESLKTPDLHNKYNKLLTAEKVTLKNYQRAYAKLFKEKFEYYMGLKDDKEYQAKGEGKKIAKQNLKTYTEADEELQQAQKLLDIQEAKVDFLSQTLNQGLQLRSYAIKNAIDWERFKAGLDRLGQ